MHTLPPARHPGKGKPAWNRLLEVALDYSKRGWRVFPLHSPTVDKCSCGSPVCKSVGKHPRTTNGLKDASTDPAMIRRWWERWPAANVGIATGPESGVFVLDVDGEDGQASLNALVEAMGQLPRTLRAHTGRTGPDGERTGFHLYFTWPAQTNLGNSVGRLGKGLDIRAAGGYVVAPPSLHVSGLCYGWAGEASAISDAPDWLIAKASRPVPDVAPMPQTCFLYEGQRNDRLFRLASAWRRRGATQDQLEHQLSVENVRRCRPPLERDEIQELAANVAHSYVPGGPDPLEEAWAKADAERHFCTWEKFLALLRHLHESRRGLPILLPVERIGKLIGCDRTLVGRHRKRAISLGFIREAKAYIAHQTATLFMVITPPE